MEIHVQALQYPGWVVALVVVFILTCWKWALLVEVANDGLSAAIHAFLLVRHPIHSEDLTKSIPTCPYRFPNGQGDVQKFLEGLRNSKDWKSEYGSVYRIWSGMRSEVVITKPEHVQVVFSDSDRHTKAFNNNSGYLMSMLLGNCLGLVSVKQWKAVRSGIIKPFEWQSVKDYVPLVQKHIDRLFEQNLGGEILYKRLLDPAEDLKMLPFWIVAEILYGELDQDMVTELKDIVPLREGLFKRMISGGLTRFSLSRYLPIVVNRDMAAFQRRWRTFNDRAYARAKTSEKSTPPIVRMYEDAHSGLVTFDNVLQTLDECLFANLDVTTGAMSWNVISLAANPDYQDKLRQELALHRQHHSSASSTEDESRRQYILNNSNTLLASCVLESARLRPAAAFSVPQSAPTPRVIDGYVIPAGTDFIIDAYSLNIHNREFWGADADVYRPERFLDKNNQGSKNGGKSASVSASARYHYWRFGFGPRQCLGKHVADVIIRSLIAYLVENYELGLLLESEEGDEGEQWRRKPEIWISHPQMVVRCLSRSR